MRAAGLAGMPAALAPTTRSDANVLIVKLLGWSKGRDIPAGPKSAAGAVSAATRRGGQRTEKPQSVWTAAPGSVSSGSTHSTRLRQRPLHGGAAEDNTSREIRVPRREALHTASTGAPR